MSKIQDDRRVSARIVASAASAPVQEAPRDPRGLTTVVGDYLREVTERFGQAWNQFWFTPTDALILSVVRVCTGLIALYTVLTYTADLELLLGSDGLLAWDTVAEMRGNYASFSYFAWLSTPTQVWIAHLAGLLVLVLFTVGLFTRVTTVLSLVVLLSYFQRSFLVTSEMEPVLTFVVFYLCFAPTGAYLSLDRFFAQRKSATEPSAVQQLSSHWSVTVVTRLIQIHLTIVYVMMLLAQLNERPWWDGTALWWILGRQESAMTDLTWLHVHPWVVNAWTHSFVLFEAAFATLAWNRLAAPLLVALSIPVWGLMAVATGLAPLAAMMIVAGLTFLAPSTLRTLLGCCGLSALVK